jgi:hypothetical protein
VVSNEIRGDCVFHRLEIAAGQSLVARGTSRRPLAPNTKQAFRIDANQLHFFEPAAAGNRLD